MYGQIHSVFRELILTTFGEKKWQDVLLVSGLNEQNDFLTFYRYPDDVTFKLIDAICQNVKQPIETVLIMFGRFCLTKCMGHGYNKLLTCMGGDMLTFLQTLDSLHSLFEIIFKSYGAPYFRFGGIKQTKSSATVGNLPGRPMCCRFNKARRIRATGNTITLHYYSHRMGIYHIVGGILEAVGQELFQQKIKVDVVNADEVFLKKMKTQHVEFKLEILSSSSSYAFLSCDNMPLLSSLRPAHNTAPGNETEVVTPAEGATFKNSVVKADDFCMAFPYSMTFDADLRVLQVGDQIHRLTDIPIIYGSHFSEFGDIVAPAIDQTIEDIAIFIDAVFVLHIFRCENDKENVFPLKGQMMWMEHSSVLLFVGSPRLTSLNELMEMNVYLADIPLYDCTRELVLLHEQRGAEKDVASKLNETTTQLRRTSGLLVEEQKKTEELLNQMLPEKVILQLTRGEEVKPEKFECVTIVFSNIATFTKIVGTCNPIDIIDMLNRLFSLFDNCSTLHEVYKVETIGDTYVGMAGAPEKQADHAHRIASFAMDIHDQSCNVVSVLSGQPLQVRVGIHSGPIVAGVVGLKMPRYCLFGDTVNVTARMDSLGVAGRIHVSPKTFELLYPYGFSFKDRGVIDVKGKGKMNTYFLTAYQGHSVVQPNDEFTALPDVCNHTPESLPQETRVHKHTRKSFGFHPTTCDSSALGMGTSEQMLLTEMSMDSYMGMGSSMSTNPNRGQGMCSLS